MRILSALNHENIEEYIKGLAGISSFDVARDKRTLLQLAVTVGYDLVLVSGKLPGSERMEYLIQVLSSKECKTQRIVYLYGEYDELCDGFISFLVDHGINDFHVGEAITSKDVQRLLYRPADRVEAKGYIQSHYDSRYFNSTAREPGTKKAGLFSVSNMIINQGLRQLFNGRSKSASFEKLVVSIISNQATGKSHTAWNMASCLSERRYSTSLINIDRGYSANLFFDIDEVYYNLLDYTIQHNEHKNILSKCYKRKNLNIITGRLGDESEIDQADFSKLLYSIRTKSDITIIDTHTGLTELTRFSIKSSTYDLMIFDCDIMHFHMNMDMLERLGDDFIPEKTIAVINNTNVKSPSHKFIYNELINSGIPFKDIAFISSCGFLSGNMMHTGLTPYNTVEEESRNFIIDMDELLDRLSAR